MGRGDGVTAIVQYPGRSFTEVQVVSDNVFRFSNIASNVSPGLKRYLGPATDRRGWPTPEVIDKAHASAAYPTALLFVHGGYHAAWCWDEHFLDYFADNGFRAFAVSLRGHGGSTRSKPLGSCSISDYVDDVHSAADRLDSEPVLVGHSMGGFVVQKHLEQYRAPAAVLMASIPPQGTLRVVLRMVRRHPWTFLRCSTIGDSADFVRIPAIARQALFSADTPDAVVESCAARL